MGSSDTSTVCAGEFRITSWFAAWRGQGPLPDFEVILKLEVN